MCGYVRRHVCPKTLREFLDLIGCKGHYDELGDASSEGPVTKHFYPAFGGDPNRTAAGPTEFLKAD